MHRQQMLDDSLDDRPSKCATFIYYTWKICTTIFSHIMLVSMVVSYCIAGAFTFEALEKQNELDVRKNISRIRNNVTRDLWTLTKHSPVLHEENWTMAVKLELKKFEQLLLTSMKSDGWDGEDDNSVQWDFTGALFYSIIVITTIGYGHIAPKTHWGKIVTIFYAILGIPLMLLCLSNIGDIMAHSFRFLYWRVCCYVCTKKPKRPQLRRGRSVRGSVRQPGGGSTARSSWRSGSSFRRSARASQRSADSALGLSDAMTYSDTGEYAQRGYRGGGGDDDLSPGINRGRFSQHSRFSDTVLVANRRGLGGPAIAPGIADLPLELAPGAPVLFNKYALDLDGARDRSGTKTVGGGGDANQHLDIPPAPLSSQAMTPLRRPAQRECRARIMSPMGFAISRQQSRGPRDFDGEWEGGTDYEYDDSSSGQRSRTKPVPIWLCVFLVVTYIFCGAFLFNTWENWVLLDSAYFCFITLTTIGFGDLVPAQGAEKDGEDVKQRIALCSLYLLFGIALLAMSFNLVQEEVINNVKSVAVRLGIIKSDEEEEEE